LCDVNLFPALNQSWGLTPFEALCAGKISVVSTESGASELLSEKEIGVVCEPTPKDFGAQILDIFENRGRYDHVAEQGHRYIKRHLTWDRYARSVLQLMNEVMSN
jgi:glycosyltransferase involved in cell wall biosynthesis